MPNNESRFCLSHRFDELAAFYGQVEMALKGGKSYLGKSSARIALSAKRAERETFQGLLGGGMTAMIGSQGDTGNVLIHRIALTKGYEWVFISEGGRESIRLVHRDFFEDLEVGFGNQSSSWSYPFLKDGAGEWIDFQVFQTSSEMVEKMNNSVNCSAPLVFQGADLRFSETLYAPLKPVFLSFNPKVGEPDSTRGTALYRIPSLAEFIRLCIESADSAKVIESFKPVAAGISDKAFRRDELKLIENLIQVYMDIASIEHEPLAAFAAMTYIWLGFSSGFFDGSCWIEDRPYLVATLRSASVDTLANFSTATHRFWLEGWDGESDVPASITSGWRSYLGVSTVIKEAQRKLRRNVNSFFFIDGHQTVAYGENLNALMQFAGIEDSPDNPALFELVADSSPLSSFTEKDFDLAEIAQVAANQGLEYNIEPACFFEVKELVNIHNELLCVIKAAVAQSA